jgi:hypothetical protein
MKRPGVPQKFPVGLDKCHKDSANMLRTRNVQTKTAVFDQRDCDCLANSKTAESAEIAVILVGINELQHCRLLTDTGYKTRDQ